MAKLTQAHAKSLHDKLGADLAEFFTDHFGVESDDDTADDTADTADETDETDAGTKL